MSKHYCEGLATLSGCGEHRFKILELGTIPGILPQCVASVLSCYVSYMGTSIHIGGHYDSVFSCSGEVVIGVRTINDDKASFYRNKSTYLNILQSWHEHSDKLLYSNTRIRINDYINHIIERVDDTSTLKAVCRGLYNHLSTESEEVDARKDGIKVVYCYAT